MDTIANIVLIMIGVVFVASCVAAMIAIFGWLWGPIFTVLAILVIWAFQRILAYGSNDSDASSVQKGDDYYYR